MNEQVTYVYAVVRAAGGAADAADAADAAAHLAGVGGGEVRTVPGTRGTALVLAVSSVPEDDFREDALRRHFEDLDWLESVARAHHGVIEALAARADVLPLRLATVYLDDDRARAVLDASWDSFAERMEHLAGHAEWGVKIYVERRPAPAGPAPAGDLSPGRAYLRTRRTERSVRESVYRAAEEAAARVEAAGRRHAAERARHRVQQGQLADAPGENVVNDAYLVHRDRAAAFHDEASRAAEGLPGVRVEVTGPWAPYSFVTPPTGAASPAEEHAT
ncbi:GvpL/GvpF family gas vesicle protein [Streptomyces tropicalis]|uniref:GvpL/GvpF family gas vesicle protein n=1 Tax=Streptomyces tropicalis TaxID=3034234 RepID=A0ABT6A4T9_9ACTN|nr:GvpL/GvpF family gas vesicle protein [Streptomyces tropicalis]MDF3298835.1 GvpL/GvpF family gas vesicle protein [Streptomyces tropicalis]